MKKTYRANQEFKDFILSEGYTQHARKTTRLTYFTHSSGTQIRVDNVLRLIATLDPNGNVITESKTFEIG